jgi:hypothetical protein
MQNVPKIVHERLRGATPAVNHPDADVLAAFTERSLPERERASVLEHLARCTDCREIVALALPPAEAAETVTRPARPGWLNWPVVRWGLAAAGMVVVASIGFIQYRGASRQAAVVAKDSRREISSYVQPAPEPPTAGTVAAPEGEAEKTLDASKVPLTAPSDRVLAKLPQSKFTSNAVPPTAHKAQSRRAFAGPVDGLRAYGPKMPTQWQQAQQSPAIPAWNVKAAAPAPSTAGKEQSTHGYDTNVPTVSQTVEVTAAPSRVETGNAETQVARQEVPSQSAEPQFDAAPGPVKAKPAMTNVIPSWAVSSTGRLQRSFDQGNTWQDVDVALKVSETPNFALAASTARAKEGNAGKKAPTTPAPVFRAVTANGADVWAGGSNGALYHSLDAGSHWLPVVPAAGGAMLTGDVVRLEFSDARHGRVLTSTGEVWITSDDGQTWQK